LYGFDNKKLHNFIKISFTNTGAYNKLKKIFYDDKTSKSGQFERTLKDLNEEGDDLKINLTRDDLARIIGSDAIIELEQTFGQRYDEILIRRC
jgi:hypothetical protein